MDQYNQDIEANLLAEQNNQSQPPVYASPANQSSALALRHQIGTDIFKMWEFSTLANLVLLLIHTGKIIASLCVIFLNPFPCISQREIWIYTMLGFDCLYIFVILARLWHVRNVKRPNRSRANRIYDENGEGLDDLEQDNQDLMTQSFVRETSKLFRNHMIIWLLTKVFQIAWFSIFLWGEYISFFTFTDKCDTTGAVTLISSFLILGYIWIFGPVLILAVLYLVLVIYYAIKKPGIAPAPNAAIDRLPVTEFNQDLPGHKECIICMIDYQQGDKIVELQCNPMHFFHEDCAKQWLRINGICPVCRVQINTNPGNNRRESQ